MRKGQRVLVPALDTLTILCEVTGVKAVGDHRIIEVTPVNGQGSRWMAEHRLRLVEGEA